MNTSTKLLSLIVVTTTAGIAGFGLANTEFAARLPLEAFLSATVSLGILRVAFSDYARRPRALALPAKLLRPVAARPARIAPRVERVAA
jgi:hypothetical protein